MTPKLRAELDRIEEFLLGDEGASLAHVLTALRGPDSGDLVVKQATTTHIRSTAFPRLAKQFGSLFTEPGSVNHYDMWDFKMGKLTLPAEGWSHFYSHITLALSALGIEYKP